MNQCLRCRFSFLAGDGLLCRKRSVQLCRHEGNVQRLEVIPGRCAQLNRNDDCPVFKPRFWVWLLDLPKRFRNVTKD